MLEVKEGRPTDERGRLKKEIRTYDFLDRLGVKFKRIDHEVAMTMEVCREIDEALQATICKNLFLCNRQETDFYLLMLPGDKKFKTRDLSKELGVSRLSFADESYMERFLDITPGSVSVMGLMNDTEGRVRLVIDEDVLAGPEIGCHPCINTSSIKFATRDLTEKIIPAMKHEYTVVSLPRYEEDLTREKQLTRVYFVRHAQAEHSEDDRNRPLTAEGEKDSGIVPELLKDKAISAFYCSPYRRSLDTIRLTAEQYRMEIRVDERLRERAVGPDGHSDESLHKRWEDFQYHEEKGESLAMVQERNMEALREILARHEGENIVIGTHGTALSTILAYYQPDFECRDFLRIAAWMPYVVELDFEGQEFRGITEHGHVDKGK